MDPRKVRPPYRPVIRLYIYSGQSIAPSVIVGAKSVPGEAVRIAAQYGVGLYGTEKGFQTDFTFINEIDRVLPLIGVHFHSVGYLAII